MILVLSKKKKKKKKNPFRPKNLLITIQQMIKTSKTSISKIKSNWVEIEKLEKDVDAMLSELGIS